MSNKKFQANRLRLARTFSGLTMAELGRRVSASRQYIQRLEMDSEQSPPSEDMLWALSELLNVQPTFFFEPLKNEFREEHSHFRRLQSAPLHIRNTVLSYGTIFNIIVEYLESKLFLEEVKIPSIPASNEVEIEEAANRCREYWGLTLSEPINNMTRTLEKAGVIVTSFEGVSDKVDALTLLGNRPIILRSTDKDSSSRSRFDLAHECGHLVMHQGKETGDFDTEAEAHRFASSFLLPSNAFVKEFPFNKSINWKSILNMKKRWGVSLQAMIRRAYDLKIINAVQYRNANIYISRQGWKKQEPNEPQQEISESIPIALEQLQMSPTDIARELNISTDILDKLGFNSEAKNNRNIISLQEHRIKRSLKNKRKEGQ